jgi:hypothetical protein
MHPSSRTGVRFVLANPSDPSRLDEFSTHLFSDPRARLVSPALRASYALVGSQLQPGQHGPLTGVHVILSNGSGDTARQQREAQILQTGLFYSAARFRIIEGSPAPAEWLEVFETDDPDPLHAYSRATSQTLPALQIHPELSASFRLAGTASRPAEDPRRRRLAADHRAR